MNRSTLLTVAGALPAGALLAVIAHGAFNTDADTLDRAAQVTTFVTLVAGTSSAAVYGVRAGIERHEETVRRSRHRRTLEPLPRRQPRTTEAPAREAVIEQPHQDVATAEEHQALAEAALPPMPAELADAIRAAGWPVGATMQQRPAMPVVDPYLTPGAVEVEPPPAPETRLDLTADLYAHPGAAEVSDDTAILDVADFRRQWAPASS